MSKDVEYLNGLKKLREENLITEEVYEKKMREYLDKTEKINGDKKSSRFYSFLLDIWDFFR